jgi:multidrug efflux pump
VRDVLARVDGVGDVTFFGARDYSMRVWLDPDRIAELGMTAGDVVAALREQNVQVAAGVIGQPPAPAGTAYQLTVSTLGRLAEAGEFGSIVIRTGRRRPHHAPLRRGACRARSARLLGQQLPVGRAGRGDGDRAAARLECARHRGAIRAAMDDLSQFFPEGLEYKIVYDPTQFVAESIAT